MFDRKPRTSGAYLLILATQAPGSQMARTSPAHTGVIPGADALAAEKPADDPALNDSSTLLVAAPRR